MKLKKILPIIVIAVLCLTVVCAFVIKSVNHSNSNNTSVVSSDKPSDADKDKTKDKTEKESDDKDKDTLLIYMVGSDLEARSGAGTDDLREIEESGINLKKANVLVYAGGSPKWHNDKMTEGKNTVLQLGKKGFEPVAEMASSNMGESATLLEFLNYSYNNYPSSSYSLIMWDHGNGPVIGYGKDMLFDNDSLTLLEMDNALKASPFGNGKKLEWVGFDACLMASAELACIWDNYAKYLVASQEVEPSFGWNYSFLKDFGVKEPATLLHSIVDQYIGACNAYYEKRGYDDRDTTLACMNLSYAGELESAIDSLFARADQDVYTAYNTLVSKRVDTRALGRASTGSEYDLIDLKDMADQLNEVYPEEAKAIGNAVNKIVVKNGTNTQGCCGLSFYYPFYNKYYYEDSWGSAYGQIGLFAHYQSYLNKYQEIWLKDDMLDKYASSNTPQKVSDENRSGFDFGDSFNKNIPTYELKLTPEQNENFAEAKIYVLAKRGKDKYHVVFSDNNVVNNNGVLSFAFEGKGIYVKNKFCEYYLPVSVGYDSVGDIGRYSLKIRGKNIKDQLLQDALFNIALNKKTGDVNLSSINPYSPSANPLNMVGGKLEELDINKWDYIFPLKPDYRYLQRYDNGVVKPIEEWVGDGVVSTYYFAVRDEVDFVYSALDDGQYSLIFEITDTQNNKYCSEPVDIDVRSEGKETYKPEDINVEWTGGDRVKIFETEGSTLYIKKTYVRDEIRYVLEAENSNDYAINYVFNNIIINGNILNGITSLFVKPNQNESDIFGIDFSNLTDAGAIDSIFSISGKLTAEITSEHVSVDRIKTIEKDVKININISGDAMETNLKERFPKVEFNSPFYGAFSAEQEIYNNSRIKIDLLSFGTAEDYSNPGYLCVENLTDKEQMYSIDSYSVNGFTFDVRGGGVLPPGCKSYSYVNLSGYSLKENGISQIESLKVKVSLYPNREQYYDRFTDESEYVDIKLSIDNSLDNSSNNDAGQVIFNKNNVKILITSYGFYYDNPRWNLLIENESDEDIRVAFGDEDSVASYYVSDGVIQVVAHNKKVAEVSAYAHKEVPDEFSTKIYIMDFSGTEILYTSDEPLVLKPVKMNVPTDEVKVNWTTGDEKVLDVRNGVSLVLKKLDWYDKLCYALEVQNTTDESVRYEIEDVIINDNIAVYDVKSIYAGAKEDRVGLQLPYFIAATDFGEIDEIHSISFTIKETTGFVLPTALNGHKFNINISGDAVINNFAQIYPPLDLSGAYRNARAARQVILNNNKLKVELLGFGGIYHPAIDFDGFSQKAFNSGNYGLCLENLSGSYQTVSVKGVRVNDVYISKRYSFRIPPKCKAYMSDYLADYETLLDGIESISDLSFDLSVKEDDNSDADATSVRLPVKLN